jgi:hypothetical protein
MPFQEGALRPKDEAAQKLYLTIVMTLSDIKAADIANDSEAYYKNTIWGLQLTMDELDQEVRIRIEKDIRTVNQAVEDMKISVDDGQVNEETAKKEMRRLWRRFGDAHRFYVIKGINRTGIRKVIKDGEIDFEENDLETLKTAIRDNSGTIAGIKESGMNANDDNTNDKGN